MAVYVRWPVKTGDHESITFVWPGTVNGDATYRCQVRQFKGSTGDPLATATCSSPTQVSANVEVTVSLTSTQTRALQSVPGAFFDVEESAAGIVSTFFEGDVDIDKDVTV